MKTKYMRQTRTSNAYLSSLSGRGEQFADMTEPSLHFTGETRIIRAP